MNKLGGYIFGGKYHPRGTTPEYCLRIPIRFEKNHYLSFGGCIEPLKTSFEPTSTVVLQSLGRRFNLGDDGPCPSC